jgi:transposase
MGPAQPSANRSGLAEAYRIEAFSISIAQRKAKCPGGFSSTQCSRIEQTNAKVVYRFEWSYHCRACPLRADCVTAGQSHRTIVVGEDHELLQSRRREQQTPEFRLRMHRRNAIEGTLSELVRGHGLRRSRYRGFAKARLQNLFIATACNIKRWLRILQAINHPSDRFLISAQIQKALFNFLDFATSFSASPWTRFSLKPLRA